MKLQTGRRTGVTANKVFRLKMKGMGKPPARTKKRQTARRTGVIADEVFELETEGLEKSPGRLTKAVAIKNGKRKSKKGKMRTNAEDSEVALTGEPDVVASNEDDEEGLFRLATKRLKKRLHRSAELQTARRTGVIADKVFELAAKRLEKLLDRKMKRQTARRTGANEIFELETEGLEKLPGRSIKAVAIKNGKRKSKKSKMRTNSEDSEVALTGEPDLTADEVALTREDAMKPQIGRRTSLIVGRVGRLEAKRPKNPPERSTKLQTALRTNVIAYKMRQLEAERMEKSPDRLTIAGRTKNGKRKSKKSKMRMNSEDNEVALTSEPDVAVDEVPLNHETDMAADEEVTSDEDGNESRLTGLRRMMIDYNEGIISVRKFKEEIDKLVADYDKRKEEEKIKATNDQGPDEDGFVRVVRRKKRTFVADDRQVEKKRKKDPLVNFYAHQIRESKMNQLTQLREQFEKDKKKLATMKTERKFKPL